MKTHSRRNRRNRTPEVQQKKETPFFTRQTLQTKEESFFQTKLTVGQPGDKYEQEADAVAGHVVNNQPGAVQKMGDKEKDENKMPPKEEDKKLQKQEQAMPEEKKKKEEKGTPPAVMTKSESGSNGSSDELADQLQRKKGKGDSLATSTNRHMGRMIGADFSGVSIHTDQESAQMNKDLGAQAFTHGNDIYFNSGKYDPASSKGKELLAHELTHVVQQNAAPPAIQKESSTPLPPGVKPDKKTKIAKFTSDGFLIKILPDKQAKKGSTEVKEGGAVTNGKIIYHVNYKTEGGKVVEAMVSKELDVQTTYGAKAKATDTSAYGRGTTAEDKEKGDTSLKFHEGNHGLDFINYVASHPFPVLEVTEPLTKQEYDEKYSEWEKQVKEYNDAMQADSVKRTDKVGDAV